MAWIALPLVLSLVAPAPPPQAEGPPLDAWELAQRDKQIKLGWEQRERRLKFGTGLFGVLTGVSLVSAAALIPLSGSSDPSFDCVGRCPPDPMMTTGIVMAVVCTGSIAATAVLGVKLTRHRRARPVQVGLGGLRVAF
ncbi:hypothetical protein [Nannocystis bainbridge]|uniref:Transmembrane protein n=1 Tax=Nannocystis bainbridge TaxID=2995303 RepID=A0ABT5DSG8_9BACT|nr:hypothetical protein [Nannocystis bainbridge]MDC0716592.1 hypothetical protein [Nannocystis bainbridge]